MDTQLHEVDRYVDAAPEVVYGMVSDVSRMGEWSSETYRCSWRPGSMGPAVGARFRAWNRRGWMRWFNTPTVIAADVGREFAFDRRVLGMSVIWRYSLETLGEGTVVRESYRLRRGTPRWLDWLIGKELRMPDRHAELDEGMRQTLDRLATAARR